jgi:hypothetical protein
MTQLRQRLWVLTGQDSREIEVIVVVSVVDLPLISSFEVLVVLSLTPFSGPLTSLQMSFTTATSRKAVKIVSCIILRLVNLVKNALS